MYNKTIFLIAILIFPLRGFAGTAPYPSMVDSKLQVATFYDDAGGVQDPNSLITPIGMVFLPNNNPAIKFDMLVIEKNTGKVKRIKFDLSGQPMGPSVTVLDLAVNTFSERGLLGIALHPDLNASGGKVYLYFTEKLDVNNTPIAIPAKIPARP